jgi:hypothetical protein
MGYPRVYVVKAWKSISISKKIDMSHTELGKKEVRI